MAHILAHIKAIQREINISVNLGASTTREHSHVSRRLLSLLESLKIYDQNRWNPEDLELFGSLNMVFTLVTVPFVVLIQ